MSNFTEQLNLELYKPDHWDIADAGFETLGEFFEKFAAQQKRAAAGLIQDAGELATYIRNYEIYYKAHVEINIRMAYEFAYSGLSDTDKATFDYMREQERQLKLGIDAFKRHGGANLDLANLRKDVARFASTVGKNLAGFVGIAEILEAASSGRPDEVGKVSAGVLAGYVAGEVVEKALFRLALRGLIAVSVASGPVGWIIGIAIGLAVEKGAEKGAEALWERWISSDADKKIRELEESVEKIYGSGSPIAQQVKEQLRGSAERLGELNGTWLEGFTELSSEQKAFLTFLLFAPSSNRFRDPTNHLS